MYNANSVGRESCSSRINYDYGQNSLILMHPVGRCGGLIQIKKYNLDIVGQIGGVINNNDKVMVESVVHVSMLSCISV